VYFVGKETFMQSFILGGGVTGLAAGLSSGLPLFEAAVEPGGICSSYYVRPGSQQRLAQAPSDENAYRFEIGGGHWIFGGDATILHFLRSVTPLCSLPPPKPSALSGSGNGSPNLTRTD
jgi:protoporphyrinogen oxidase